MRSSVISFSWFISFFIALILLVSCNDLGKKKPVRIEGDMEHGSLDLSGDSMFLARTERESIVFILGQDTRVENPYYTEATRYFENAASEKSTHLNTQCRSLAEVHAYLQNHAPVNGFPWGKIHLVSHGDEWMGLSVKISPNGLRSTSEHIEAYMQTSEFKCLPDSIIDPETEIEVHACGVGNNPQLIQTLSRFFQSVHSQPQMIAPRLFEFYTSDQGPQGTIRSDHYLTNAWLLTFPRKEKPGIIQLCNLFQQKYHQEQIAWADALSRKSFHKIGESYTYEFDVPVHAVINLSLADTFPKLITQESKVLWLNQQPQIQYILSQIKLPAESFSWELKKGFVKGQDGKRALAIAVTGYATMVCVLKPLVSENPATPGLFRPFIPEYTDTAYYYITGGSPIAIKS